MTMSKAEKKKHDQAINRLKGKIKKLELLHLEDEAAFNDLDGDYQHLEEDMANMGGFITGRDHEIKKLKSEIFQKITRNGELALTIQQQRDRITALLVDVGYQRKTIEKLTGFKRKEYTEGAEKVTDATLDARDAVNGHASQANKPVESKWLVDLKEGELAVTSFGKTKKMGS